MLPKGNAFVFWIRGPYTVTGFLSRLKLCQLFRIMSSGSSGVSIGFALKINAGRMLLEYREAHTRSGFHQ